jgi:cytochrome bd ubiquinol oxidase subunit II
MSLTTLATMSAGLVLVALIAYAVLGGADFGGGVWDLLARGPSAERERAAIAQAMGPVWESNNVWLIFVLVVTWTAFPIVYAGISAALFIPITLALIGIVLRGAAFSFRSHYGMQVGTGVRWGHVFNIASTITPFLLGTIAGALASGGIRLSGPPLQVQADLWATWTTPFALSCGAFALGLCSVLSATYLTAEAHNNGSEVLTQTFRRRAMIAGAITALFGALAMALAISEAPTLWHGLIGKAAPFTLGAVVLGLATAAALFLNAYLVARVLVAAETACILLAWSVALWPYLIIPDVTITNAASPVSVLGPMLIVAILGLVVLLPSLWYLFSVFKRNPSHPGQAASRGVTTTTSFVASLPPMVTAADSPTATALQSATDTPGAAEGTQLQAVVAFLIAFASALVITGISSLVQRRYEQSRT